MNTIVSLKDMFHLSVVLCKMHSRYDVTIRWCFSFTLVKLGQALMQSADEIANKYNACCCSSR